MTSGPRGLSSAGATAPADIAATRQALRDTHDLTERRRLEDQLEALQRTVLGDELGRLSGALSLSEERRIAAERTLASVATDAAARLLAVQRERDGALAEVTALRRELDRKVSVNAMARSAVVSGAADRTLAPELQVLPRGRAWRVLLVVAVLIGILVAIDGVLTIVWQEPISRLFAQHAQHKLSQKFTALTLADKAEQTKVIHKTRHETAAHKLHDLVVFRTRKAAHLLNHAHPGDPLARISIPKIDTHFTVLEGTSTLDLQKGPGHYRGTMLPGLPGTTAIAGHRTTFEAPFRNLDQLKIGSAINVTMPYGRFRYRVIDMRSVHPSDIKVVSGRRGVQKLVLTACDPPGSASMRLVVTARLAGARSV